MTTLWGVRAFRQICPARPRADGVGTCRCGSGHGRSNTVVSIFIARDICVVAPEPRRRA